MVTTWSIDRFTPWASAGGGRNEHLRPPANWD